MPDLNIERILYFYVSNFDYFEIYLINIYIFFYLIGIQIINYY